MRISVTAMVLLIASLSACTNKVSGSEQSFATGLPDAFDIRQYICGRNIGIRYEGQCNASSAVAVADMLRHRWCIATGVDLGELSVQQIVDCAPQPTCDNRDVLVALNYALQYGLTSESSYPYVSEGRSPFSCQPSQIRQPQSFSTATIFNLPQSVTAIQSEIQKNGAVVVGVSDDVWQEYDGDIVACDDTNTTRYALLVGWRKIGAQAVWIVTNDWGTGWGEAGAAFIPIEGDDCGVSLHAVAVSF
jgi:hypothetical protein